MRSSDDSYDANVPAWILDVEILRQKPHTKRSGRGPVCQYRHPNSTGDTYGACVQIVPRQPRQSPQRGLFHAFTAGAVEPRNVRAC